MTEITLLMEEHKVALAANLNHAIEVDQHLQQHLNVFSTLQGDNESLKAKLGDLEGPEQMPILQDHRLT